MAQSPGAVSSSATLSAAVVVNPVLQRLVSLSHPQRKTPRSPLPLVSAGPSQSLLHLVTRQGSDVGDSDGISDGDTDGLVDGCIEGAKVGVDVGKMDGAAVGNGVGIRVGEPVGWSVGELEGSWLG